MFSVEEGQLADSPKQHDPVELQSSYSGTSTDVSGTGRVPPVTSSGGDDGAGPSGVSTRTTTRRIRPITWDPPPNNNNSKYHYS